MSSRTGRAIDWELHYCYWRQRAERLEAENARLRDALDAVLVAADFEAKTGDPNLAAFLRDLLHEARAALGANGDAGSGE